MWSVGKVVLIGVMMGRAARHSDSADSHAQAGKEKWLRISSEPFSLKQLVRLAGIEPTTPWFVAKYSIQLSYSRPMQAL